ncbi:RNA-binding domain-containing protein, partial [Piedraia hortae CBS 480.64]
YAYPSGYADPYAQPQQYPAAPLIQNPFGATPAGPSNTYNPEYEAAIAQWQSAYVPTEEQSRRAAANTARGAAGTQDGAQTKGEKKKTVIRKGGGQTWEDKTLLEWDPTQFRIMVGNLAGEVTDDSLAKAFAAYGVSKARVIRDKRTTKSKGYGFVSFLDGEQGFKAAREMVGKYIGSHPVTIQRSKTDIRPVTLKQDKHKNKSKK